MWLQLWGGDTLLGSAQKKKRVRVCSRGNISILWLEKYENLIDENVDTKTAEYFFDILSQSAASLHF